MFLIPVVLVDFRGRFEHVFASLLHICTHKENVSTSRLCCMWECWRWRFIAFSHSYHKWDRSQTGKCSNV